MNLTNFLNPIDENVLGDAEDGLIDSIIAFYTQRDAISDAQSDGKEGYRLCASSITSGSFT